MITVSTSQGLGRITYSILSILLLITSYPIVLGADKTNIVFRMAGDLGYGDLGCYGGEMLKTPHLDQLAREGKLFTQACAGGPVCTPSPTPFVQETWSEQSKKYASMVHRLDQGVGQIVDLLNELGLRENTLIIHTSDNGGHQDMWNESL